jgi:hypothetical protein
VKPAPHKTTWQVYATGEIYNPGMQTRTGWAWVVHGPRGHEAGCEESAQDAVNKAMGAAMMLSDPREHK